MHEPGAHRERLPGVQVLQVLREGTFGEGLQSGEVPGLQGSTPQM